MHVMAVYDMLHQGAWEKESYMSMYDKRLCHTYLYLADMIDKLTPDQIIEHEKKFMMTGSNQTQLERSMDIIKHAIMNSSLISKELIPHYQSVGKHLGEIIGITELPPIIDTGNENFIIDQLRTCEFILTGFSSLKIDVLKSRFSEFLLKMGLYLNLLTDEQLQAFIECDEQRKRQIRKAENIRFEKDPQKMVDTLINELEFNIKLRKDFNTNEFLYKHADFALIFAGFNRAIDVIKYWKAEYPNLLAPLRMAFKTGLNLGAVPDGDELELYQKGYDECVKQTEVFIEKNGGPLF